MSSLFDQVDNPCQDDCADYRNDDGVDHAPLSGKAESTHNEATYYRSDDADHNVHNGPEAGALHEFSRDPASDETYDKPPENEHVSSPSRSWICVKDLPTLSSASRSPSLSMVRLRSVHV